MRLDKKQKLLQKRRWRIRKKIKGTKIRPRLTICLTNMHIHAQCINDENRKTLVALSSISKIFIEKKLKVNILSATILGEKIGKMMKKNNIHQCVFDRAGRRYHGRIKAFADAVRETGIHF